MSVIGRRFEMRFSRIIAAMFALVFIAGCTFQSGTILPDPDASGDPIAGFPTDAPFRLESFDRQKSVFHYIGTMTPQAMEPGRIRYTLVFEGDSKKLRLQAKKLSANNYVLRYTELDDNTGNLTTDSALVFVTLENGTYYVLTSLVDKSLFDKIYRDGTRPAIDDGTITFDAGQAAQLSAFFGDHRGEFLVDQDYVRMRLMP